jgi:hypothetical protein
VQFYRQKVGDLLTGVTKLALSISVRRMQREFRCSRILGLDRDFDARCGFGGEPGGEPGGLMADGRKESFEAYLTVASGFDAFVDIRHQLRLAPTFPSAYAFLQVMGQTTSLTHTIGENLTRIGQMREVNRRQ